VHRLFRGLIVFTAFFLRLAFASNGVDRGGGDRIALDFMQIGFQIHAQLSDSYPQNMPAISLAGLLAAVQETRIETTDKPLVLNGIEKDALNFPAEKRIVVNRPRWEGVTELNLKVGIVFHEYLGILREKDQNYAISSRFRRVEIISGQSDLDAILQELRAVQQWISAYFGPLRGFTYDLNLAAAPDISSDSPVLKRLRAKLPFLFRDAGGHLGVNPPGQAVSQFNTLKTAYVSLLNEAVYFDRRDRRLIALARWARDTNVVYPGEQMGREIITYSEFKALGLPER
jgi:hypothetical protein